MTSAAPCFSACSIAERVRKPPVTINGTLTSLRIALLARAAGLPDGALEVVTGAGAAGRALVESADMIFFTGGAQTGTAVAEACARRLIPVVLELGGKSAKIVCADADLERAAASAVWAGAGAACPGPGAAASTASAASPAGCGNAAARSSMRRRAA